MGFLVVPVQEKVGVERLNLGGDFIMEFIPKKNIIMVLWASRWVVTGGFIEFNPFCYMMGIMG